MKGFPIRKAVPADLPEIRRVYDCAREYMRSSGNMTQWSNGYPSDRHILKDIADGNLYVAVSPEDRIFMAFAFIIGQDPTYEIIEDGNWLDDSTYGTIHRIGSDGTRRGVLRMALDFCFSIIPNIRIDTHKDNKKMLDLLEAESFIRCGVIYCQDGTAREAFQSVRRNA